MLEKLLAKISYDIAIDLGTSSILIFVLDKGIIVNEPSVLALHKKTRQVLALGEEARSMIGKTPQNLETIRPLRNGVISDFRATEQLLSHYVRLVNNLPTRFPKYPRPKVIIGVPSGLTSVERRAVEEATLNAGARKVFLVQEPMAAAIGAGLEVRQPRANMIVDSGGGTTEIAVISLAGMVINRSLKLAGDQLDLDIVNHARQKYNLLLGEKTAENLKQRFGSASEIHSTKADFPDKFVFQGRDLKTGLPRSITASPIELREAMRGSLHTIVAAIRDVIEATPAELMPDILQTGVTLAGGTSLLSGFPRFLSSELHTPVHLAGDPVSCVVRGCAALLEDPALLELVRVR